MAWKFSFKNSEGYSDPTAFNAINNAEGKKKMNKGEIWEIKMANGSYKNVIVLADHGNLSTVLQVTDFNDFGCIEIVCHGIKYTDPRRIQYSFNDNFTDYIRTLKDEEMDHIMNAVSEALGLNAAQPEKVCEQPEKVIEKIVEVPAASDSETMMNLAKAQAERDIYKGLYEKLLADVIKGA